MKLFPAMQRLAIVAVLCLLAPALWAGDGQAQKACSKSEKACCKAKQNTTQPTATTASQGTSATAKANAKTAGCCKKPNTDTTAAATEAPKKCSKTTKVTNTNPEETKTAQVGTNGSAGLMVQIDPNTGTFSEEVDRGFSRNNGLEAIVNTSDEGLVEEKLSNGTVLMDLQGRFQSATVAHIGPDGKLHTNCVSHLAHGEKKAEATQDATKKE